MKSPRNRSHRNRNGSARHRRRKAIPTLTRLEGRELLSHASYLTASPGLIVSSSMYTATPNYGQAVGGIVPVTVSGQFVAQNPSIKLRDYSVVQVGRRYATVPAADDGDVLYVFPQKVFADFQAVGPDRQLEPSGIVNLTQKPYSTPGDPLYQKNKDKFDYQFSFVTYLPSVEQNEKGTLNVGLQYSITVGAQSRDSGYYGAAQVDLLRPYTAPATA